MNWVKLSEMSAADLSRITQRAGAGFDAVTAQARTIMDEVRARGDAAVRDYTARFDKVELGAFEVTEAEIAAALETIPADLKSAIQTAIANVATFHRAQLERMQAEATQPIATVPGAALWREWRAIDKVGLYVPGGKAPLFSSLIMMAVPARIAGCREIVFCSPPTRDGTLPTAMLATAALCGVHRVFKIGGAQAVAAMAYGTESVPKVHKIFGPGNSYVTAAKMLAFSSGHINIDLPAGPSEILIVADDTAEARFVAADFLSQAEHAEDSAPVLLTTSPRLAAATAAEVERQLGELGHTAERARTSVERYGLIAVVDTLDEAVDFINEYAPEHLEICVRDDLMPGLLAQVRNGGSIFLGNYTPEPLADYVSGLNHVLPTGQFGKMFGPLSLESFGRMLQVQKFSRDALFALRSAAESLAEAESLPGHRRAIAIRFED